MNAGGGDAILHIAIHRLFIMKRLSRRTIPIRTELLTTEDAAFARLRLLGALLELHEQLRAPE